MNVSFLELLRKLTSLGPKIPAAVGIIEHIISDVKDLIALLGDGFAGFPRSAGGGVLTEAELAEATRLEGEIVAECNREESTEEGLSGPLTDRLRAIFDFVKENPEFVQFILMFFK